MRVAAFAGSRSSSSTSRAGAASSGSGSFRGTPRTRSPWTPSTRRSARHPSPSSKRAARTRREWARTKPDPRARVLRREGDSIVVELFTRGEPQHYLCGQDESHLFIAQLARRASSIAGAHALLAPRVPWDYGKQRCVRQGEWFFFAATPSDGAELERLGVLGYGLRTNVGIAEAARLSRPGRPHVVSELRLLKGSTAQPGRRIFVRGEVRHPDHRTLVLRDWHRVLPNGELTPRRTRGVLWVD